MSRPKKATVDYFPHFCSHKQTMFIIEQRFGNDGYAFWFKLLEMLGSAEGHYLNLNETETWEFLQAKTRLDGDTCKNILDLLSKLKAIGPDLWEKKIVWSDNFIEGVSRVYVNRRVELPKKPDNYTQQPEPVGISTQQNPQSKVKYSKAKNPSLPPFEEFWNLYPKRKGKKLGKKECQDFIKTIKLEEWESLLKATKNYAESDECKNGYARDPIRFLKKDYWRDWIDIKGVEPGVSQKSLPKFDEDKEFLCADCRQVKPKTEREYGEDSRSRCKVCHAKYLEEWKKKHADDMKRLEENWQKLSLTARKYQIEHRAKLGLPILPWMKEGKRD